MLPENLVWLIPAFNGLCAIIAIVIAYNLTRPTPIIEHVVMRIHPTLPMNRHTFMEFFRDDDDDHMGSLSVEDRIEIFRTVLTGSSDFSVKLLNEILQDYSVENIVAVDTTGMDEHILAELVE